MSILNNMPHKCRIQRLIHSQGMLGGSKTTPTTEQTDVLCWEQAASHAEVMAFQKRGMRITHKVYFTADPQVTEQHQIVMTERNGTAIAAADQVALDVKSEPRPDASAGTGAVWKVMCDILTGSVD